jgi:hypothetical protein
VRSMNLVLRALGARVRAREEVSLRREEEGSVRARTIIKVFLRRGFRRDVKLYIVVT